MTEISKRHINSQETGTVSISDKSRILKLAATRVMFRIVPLCSNSTRVAVPVLPKDLCDETNENCILLISWLQNFTRSYDEMPYHTLKLTSAMYGYLCCGSLPRNKRADAGFQWWSKIKKKTQWEIISVSEIMTPRFSHNIQYLTLIQMYRNYFSVWNKLNVIGSF